MKRTACALLLAVALLLPATQADAQIFPFENHYKVYDTPGPTVVDSIFLRDQFSQYLVSDLILEKFANPADKNGEGILEPLIHQTWWRLFVPAPIRAVTATDQFGNHVWTVADGAYLLVPALKNDPTGQEPPPWNHYLCYDAVGPVPNVPVTITDQFGTISTVILEGKYFCNPVEKTHGGVFHPILYPDAHLTCYQIDDPNIYDIDITATDQFGFWLLNIQQSWCLCAPAYKEDVVRTEETWGRIKALYGNE